MINISQLIGIFLIVIGISLLAYLVLWIWAYIDCIKSDLSTIEKVIWVLIITFFPLLGMLAYFITVKIIKLKMAKTKQLFRSKNNRVIAGVCGGIGEYMEVDPTIVRLIWVLLTIFSMGVGIIAYIVCWILIPERLNI